MAHADLAVAAGKLDTLDPFGHLEPELRLDPQPRRRPVLDRQRPAVRLQHQDRLLRLQPRARPGSPGRT
jgi:hypothetical protein